MGGTPGLPHHVHQLLLGLDTVVEGEAGEEREVLLDSLTMFTNYSFKVRAHTKVRTRA